jgi:beta-lactamase superfamily II metal-dependent hydrolase
MGAGMKMRRFRWLQLSPAYAFLLTFAVGPAQAWGAKNDLQIYFVDVEGGQSTLFVTPTGQSMLIDTGWPDNAGRDADRILAAAKLAGIKKIDYVLLTHYHNDHSGGVPQLVDRISVGTFIDHGANIDTKPGGATLEVWDAYQKILATGKYKHIVAKPGDVIPITGMKVTIISSDGNVIDHPLPGGGAENEYCKIPDNKPMDRSENSHSLGVLINFGKLKILDLGDLTWDKEMLFMCPKNLLGSVDILVVSHHGFRPSSSHALVDGIHPRVAIMNNASAKGGNIPVLDTVREAPGLETLWQLHYSDEGGPEHNTATEYIANPQGTEQGNYVLLTATPNGSFTVFNSGNKQSKNYAAR